VGGGGSPPALPGKNFEILNAKFSNLVHILCCNSTSYHSTCAGNTLHDILTCKHRNSQVSAEKVTIGVLCIRLFAGYCAPDPICLHSPYCLGPNGSNALITQCNWKRNTEPEKYIITYGRLAYLYLRMIVESVSVFLEADCGTFYVMIQMVIIQNI